MTVHTTPIPGEPFLRNLLIAPSPCGQTAPVGSMTPQGLLAPHPYDDYSLSQAKSTVLAQPVSTTAWSVFGDKLLDMGYGDAAIMAWREGQRFGPLGENYVRDLAQLEAGAQLLLPSLNPDVFSHLAMVLRIFRGTLPVFWCRQFMYVRYRATWKCWYTEATTPFDPTRHVPVIDGLAGLGDGSKTIPELDVLLGYLFAPDTDPQVEEEKNNVRKAPRNGAWWERLIRQLVQTGREEVSKVFLSCARRIDGKYFEMIAAEATREDTIVRAARTEGATTGFDIERLHVPFDRYFTHLRRLSDPPVQLRLDPHNIDFPTNEWHWPDAVEGGTHSFAGRGGVYIGTGAGLVFPHMVHQRATAGYVVDYNRVVTEGVLPCIGLLLDAAESPAQFVAALCSIPLTAAESEALRPLSGAELFTRLANRPSDEATFRTTMTTLCRLLLSAGDPTTAETIARAVIAFFYEHNFQYTLFRRPMLKRLTETGPSGRGGILGDEATFRAAQALWREGRIIGVSADWTGGVMGRIAADCAQRSQLVGAIYPSNILEHLDENGRGAIKAFAQGLTTLPHDGTTVVATTERGGGTGMRYTMTDYLAMLRFETAHDSTQATRLLMKVLAAHHGGRSHFFTGHLPTPGTPEYEAWNSRLLTRAVLAIGKPHKKPRVTTARARRIAARSDLGPNDAWRFLFFLRMMGCLID